MRELVAVNTLINRSIRPERNQGGLSTEQWLLYPASGDCNDYAVTKRHELLNRKWPIASLLIAVVLVAGGEGHAVLVVPTDHGDFVLDNLRSGVVRWDILPYQWLKIMSPENPLFWRRIQSLAPVHSGAFFCPDTVDFDREDRNAVETALLRTKLFAETSSQDRSHSLYPRP